VLSGVFRCFLGGWGASQIVWNKRRSKPKGTQPRREGGAPWAFGPEKGKKDVGVTTTWRFGILGFPLSALPMPLDPLWSLFPKKEMKGKKKVVDMHRRWLYMSDRAALLFFSHVCFLGQLRATQALKFIRRAFSTQIFYFKEFYFYTSLRILTRKIFLFRPELVPKGYYFIFK